MFNTQTNGSSQPQASLPKIESNVELKPRSTFNVGREPKWKKFLVSMRVGESFVIPVKQAGVIYQHRKALKAEFGFDFTARTESKQEKTVRFWRTK